MKSLILLAVLSLTGCATMSDYCEVHSKGCVITGEVVGAVVITSVAISMSHKNQVVVVQNPPPATK